MARPKYQQAKVTSLKVAISASEASEIILSELVDLYGNALALTDFANTIYFTFAPGTTSEEIIGCTAFTVNSDGSVTLDTGIVRGVDGTTPYSTGGTAYSHAAGTRVVISNNPQIYEEILDYIDAVAIAGGSDASTTGKGFMEVATTAEIDADEDFGATGAYVGVNPSFLALSKYGTRLPSSAQKTFLDGVIGAILPYGGQSAPSGFNMCDGSTLANNTYPLLAAVLLGRYGYGTATTFTADAGTNVCTATSHGMSNGQRVFVASTTTLPAGLSANTIYFVISATTNTFKLSTSEGGSEIDITDAGTGTHSFYTSFLVPDLKARFPLGYAASAPTKVFTFVSRSSNTITVSGGDNHTHSELQTGQAVVYSAPSGAMTGLVHNTTYYLIRVAYNQFQLATSLSNSIEGTAIALSSDGTGAQTFTVTYTARPMAQKGGTELLTDVPTHKHSVYSYTTNDFNDGTSGWSSSGSSRGTATATLDDGDATPNNMPLFTVVNYIIKTD